MNIQEHSEKNRNCFGTSLCALSYKFVKNMISLHSKNVLKILEIQPIQGGEYEKKRKGNISQIFQHYRCTSIVELNSGGFSI